MHRSNLQKSVTVVIDLQTGIDSLYASKLSTVTGKLASDWLIINRLHNG